MSDRPDLDQIEQRFDPHDASPQDFEALIAYARTLETALRATVDALDDAIAAAVNAEWTQADYDQWDTARTQAERLLREGE